MGNKRRSVRFDEHTWMLLKEVSEKMGVNMSVTSEIVIILRWPKQSERIILSFDRFVVSNSIRFMAHYLVRTSFRTRCFMSFKMLRPAC